MKPSRLLPKVSEVRVISDQTVQRGCLWFDGVHAALHNFVTLFTVICAVKVHTSRREKIEGMICSTTYRGRGSRFKAPITCS